MPIETRSNTLHSPVGAALATLGAVALGAVIGGGCGLAMVWTGDDAGRAAAAALMGGGAWAVGALIGLALIATTGTQDAGRLSFAVLVASVVRMLGALALGLVLFFGLGPEGRTFWTTFLVCGLLALMAETSWAMHTLKSGAARSRPDGAH